MASWTNENVLEFLELYEAEPVLWNPYHPSHKSKTASLLAWKVIVKNLSVKRSVRELKKKKESLMSSYQKCFRTKDFDGKHCKDWFAYDRMTRFLHNVYEPMSATAEELPSLAENITQIVRKDSLTDTSAKSSASESSNEIFPSDAKKQKLDRFERVENGINKTYTLLEQMSQNTTHKDQCSLYTDLLCNKLRSLDAQKREMAMNEIDTVVNRIKHLAPQVSHQQPLYPQPVYPKQSYSYQKNFQSHMQSMDKCYNEFISSFPNQLSPNLPPLLPLLSNTAPLPTLQLPLSIQSTYPASRV